MDLKAINAFRAVAELGSISRASAYLRLAQPALSRLIQKLEHGLGVKLLQRSSTGVTLTVAGRVLLERTAGLESSLAEIAREVSGYSSEVLGPLRVGVQPPLSHLAMPDLVRRYMEAHPRVDLHVHEGYSADLVDGLLDETIDIVVAETPSHSSRELLVLPLWVEALHLFGPADAGETAPFSNGSATLAQALQLPLILPSPRYAIRKLIEQTASREHLRVRPLLEVDGPDMIFGLVRSGLGYALMPALGARTSSRGRLCSVPTKPEIDRPMSILVRAAVAAEPKVATFVRLFREAVVGLAETDRLAHVRLTFDAPPAPVGEGGPALRAIGGGRKS